jgi:Ni/Co efflux regulator RcnB
MKRIATTALAALMIVGPLAGTASAQQWRGNDSRNERNDDRNDRRDDRRDDRQDRREDRQDRRADRREERREARWDQRRHNGYYANGRYYRGAPPAWAQQRNDYRPGYQSWRRGERLPSYYRSHYREVDWRRAHYRQPPRGYHYVRDDNTGEVLLVALATGVILSILLSQ